MYFQDIGKAVRNARIAQQITQAELADRVGLSRVTVNQLESGVFPDLGINKLLSVLETVGLDLAITKKDRKKGPRDYLRLACISANVGYKTKIKPDALARMLMTGKVVAGTKPNMRVVFEELPEEVFAGVVSQVGNWREPDKLSQNIRAIAKVIGSSKRAA